MMQLHHTCQLLCLLVLLDAMVYIETIQLMHVSM